MFSQTLTNNGNNSVYVIHVIPWKTWWTISGARSNKFPSFPLPLSLVERPETPTWIYVSWSVVSSLRHVWNAGPEYNASSRWQKALCVVLHAESSLLFSLSLCLSLCLSSSLTPILHKGSSLFEPSPFFRGNTPLCSQREESWFRDLWNLSRSIQRLLKYNACIVDWR